MWRAFHSTIRRSGLALALTVLCLVGCARPTQRPFLWMIEPAHNGAASQAAAPDTRPSFLYGTMHLPNPRVTAMPPVVTAALRCADSFYAEMPLNSETQHKALAASFLPRGQSLRKLLPPDLYRRVSKFYFWHMPVLGIFGPPDQLKIWTVAVLLEGIDNLGDFAFGGPAPDQRLWNTARRYGKQTAGLETVDEQIAVFDELSQAEQIQVLRNVLDQLQAAHRRGTTTSRELLQLYLEGDAEKLAQRMQTESEGGSDPELQRKMAARLIGDRNARMATRIVVQLQRTPARSCFFAVGVGHTVGPDSIVARLVKAGYTVRRLTPADADGLRAGCAAASLR